MQAAHAKLSPSASSRWIKCPGSIRLTAEIKRETNPMALRGTFIHQIGENLLNGKSQETGQSIIVPDEDMQYISKDMLEEAQNYFNYVDRIVKLDDNSELIVEMNVDLTDIAPDTFGHADAVVVENGILHIIDLKTGATLVDSKENSQLKLYGYGAYKELDMFHDIDTIRLHIVQDNAKTGVDRSNSWDISVDDLVHWIENEAIPAAKEALSEDSKCVPGETQCHWCDAASFCTALHDQAESLIDDAFDDLDDTTDEKEAIKNAGDTVTIEKVVKFLEKAKLINKLISSYNDRVLKDLNLGKSVPGFKLVKSNKHKKWVDEIEAFDKVKTWAPIDDVAPRKLVTPTQAEKLLGQMSTQKKNKFNTLWVKPEGDLVAAFESDKRQAQKPLVDTEFDDLDEDDEL